MIKGLKKAGRGRQPFSLVIQGELTKYVPGLEDGDYAVVLPHSLYTQESTVHGKVMTCYQGIATLAMPLDEFDRIELIDNSNVPSGGREYHEVTNKNSA